MLLLDGNGQPYPPEWRRLAYVVLDPADVIELLRPGRHEYRVQAPGVPPDATVMTIYGKYVGGGTRLDGPPPSPRFYVLLKHPSFEPVRFDQEPPTLAWGLETSDVDK